MTTLEKILVAMILASMVLEIYLRLNRKIK